MTRHVLVLGAGRSSGALIDYLADNAATENWRATICDVNLEHAQSRVAGREPLTAESLDATDDEATSKLIAGADLVISLLPPTHHAGAARLCLRQKTPLLTASYVTDDLSALDADVRAAGLLFLGECGLDPGLDHLSGMRVIDRIRRDGDTLTAFETFTGGLIAPDPDANPWDYKFTWNPRNVVLAGQGGVKFIQKGMYKYIPYHRLFRRTEIIHIPGHGYFEGYANRDSLKYLDIYGLRGVETLYRGTLRRIGFCPAWDVFVQLGATDDTYEMEGVESMSHREFINSFLSYNPYDSVELKLAQYMKLEMGSQEMFRLEWLGIFDHTPVGLERGTPAQILEHILRKKWAFQSDDRDMVVMWHKFDFVADGKAKQIQSHVVCFGDAEHTAMARTVGLPLGVAAKLMLRGELKTVGVHRPVVAELYEPILEELERYGIEFVERETDPAESIDRRGAQRSLV